MTAHPADPSTASPDALAVLAGQLGDPQAVHRLVRAYPTWARLRAAPRADLVAHAGTAAAHLTLPEHPNALAATTTLQPVTAFDPTYPPGLADLPSAPLLLWTLGPIPLRPMLAVGGSLYPCAAGVSAASAAGRLAAAAGIPVVAALDTGTGHAAIEAALAGGGVVAAVAACDPSVGGGQTGLVRRILALGGCVLTEARPGTGFSEAQVYAATRLVAAVGSAVVLADLGRHPAGGVHLARAAVACRRFLIVPGPPPPPTVTTPPSGVELLAVPHAFTATAFGTSARIQARLGAGLPAADAVVGDDVALMHVIAATCDPRP